MTDWKQALAEATAGREHARAIEEQAIRDARAAGATTTQIAEALGIKSRWRVTEAERNSADPASPVLGPVVYLRGAGRSDETWERMRQAMWARGWHTTPDRTAAWHLARGGHPTVLVDFSTTVSGVIVTPVVAKYVQDEAELVAPKGRDGHPYLGTRTPEPVIDDPEGRPNPAPMIVPDEAVARAYDEGRNYIPKEELVPGTPRPGVRRVLDVERIARLVASELSRHPGRDR
ncbi:hypothetical protein AB0B28_08065 [Glycomyces sp. NPDC046736]|uniref:hypothetical protein n=1 Tax=Glycomyces sp. NPDC046736 TaxID=3155615 RepID=UPI0033D03456